MARVFTGKLVNGESVITIPRKVPIIIELGPDERRALAKNRWGFLKRLALCQHYCEYTFGPLYDVDVALARAMIRKNVKPSPKNKVP